MTGYKQPNLDERLAASKAAKLEALAKLRKVAATPKPAAASDEGTKSAREIAAEERRAAHRAAIEQDKAARIEAREKAKEEAASVKPPLTEAERKAARDARYAARKARKR